VQNVDHWNRISDEWLETHGVRGGVWGAWAIPESEVCALGDVRGLDVLELGCGSGGWSLWLAEQGARVVGLDPSPRQLDQAKRLQLARGVEFDLVEAPAEDVPLRDGTFDLVMSDYGACTWSEPYSTVAEVSRLLRPGGRFVVNTTTPIAHICFDDEEGFGSALVRAYFGLHVVEQPWGVTGYQLTYGEWIGVFAENGLAVEALIELRPRPDAGTTHNWVPSEWANRWPAENIWKVRKALSAPSVRAGR
jgi:SAM-dependent methyltransferase